MFPTKNNPRRASLSPRKYESSPVKPKKADKYEKKRTGDSPYKSKRSEDSPYKQKRTTDSPYKSKRTEDSPYKQKRTGDSPYKSKRTEDSPYKQKRTTDSPYKFKRTGDTPNREKRPEKFEKKQDLYVWGKRPVEALLASLHQNPEIENSKYSLHIIVDKTKSIPQQLKPIAESAQVLGIKIVSHDSAEEGWPLVTTVEDLNHQRVCLRVPEYPTQDLSEAIQIVSAMKESVSAGCAGIVLDQIQDPRNFGAIIRSAAFFGLKFVVYGTDRQADLSPTVLKSSSGGAFALSLIPTVNISRALQQLKNAGAWIVGTALTENAINSQSLPSDRLWVAVVGNEGKGIRNEVLKNCDYVVKIGESHTPNHTIDSLNVSVATGVLLHILATKP